MGGPEEIESDFSLPDEMAFGGGVHSGVGGGKSGDKVVAASACVPFGDVTAMVAGGDELGSYTVSIHDGAKIIRHDVIHDFSAVLAEFAREGFVQEFEAGLVCASVCCCGLASHEFEVDVVAVLMVHDKNMETGVAVNGADGVGVHFVHSDIYGRAVAGWG